MVEKISIYKFDFQFLSNQGAFDNKFDSEGKTGESICDESCKKRNGLFLFLILTNFPSLKLICYDCLYRRNFHRTYSSNDQILPVWFRFGTDGLKIIQ